MQINKPLQIGINLAGLSMMKKDDPKWMNHIWREKWQPSRFSKKNGVIVHQEGKLKFWTRFEQSNPPCPKCGMGRGIFEPIPGNEYRYRCSQCLTAKDRNGNQEPFTWKPGWKYTKPKKKANKAA
jgi:hypothetical protein